VCCIINNSLLVFLFVLTALLEGFFLLSFLYWISFLLAVVVLGGLLVLSVVLCLRHLALAILSGVTLESVVHAAAVLDGLGRAGAAGLCVGKGIFKHGIGFIFRGMLVGVEGLALFRVLLGYRMLPRFAL
jgi:hypothetical protein